MIWTAIFQNAVTTGNFSRAIVFDGPFEKELAWEKAVNMEIQGSEVAGIDGDFLFCITKGSHEIWSPDCE